MRLFFSGTLLLTFFLLFNSFVFPQSTAWDIPESRSAGENIGNGLKAGGEILLMNGAFTLINWATGWPWAVPTPESIRLNLTTPWQWEHEDGFIVNQLGHPFQGSLYFNAGRVNGFGFYENLLFSAFGSVSWEVFFESNKAAINDFFTTVPGSLAAGEMSYRLYVEASAAGIPAPLAFILSPAAGLHRLLTGWEPPPASRNLYELRLLLGLGYAHTRSFLPEGQVFSFDGIYSDIGFKFIYANPFEQDTNVPFRHFELAMSYGMQPGVYQEIRTVSDGYLFAFSPLYDSRQAMSTGLTLNLDFNSRGKFHIHDSTINQYSNALNWTFKYRNLLSHDTVMHVKGHGGITFMGSSKYFSPVMDTELNNFGYGLNSKLFFNLENPNAGRIEADLYGYILWSYPGTTYLSSGRVYWLFADLGYSIIVSGRPEAMHVSLGITASLAREWGHFGNFPDTRKRNDSVKFFAAWNF